MGNDTDECVKNLQVVQIYIYLVNQFGKPVFIFLYQLIIKIKCRII